MMNHPEHEWEQQREQLSALLDNALTTQERAALEAHLGACAWCHVELESLRRTRALLHALPQPALPRSFTLPLEPAAAPIPQQNVTSLPSASERMPTQLPRDRATVSSRRRPVRLLQWVSAIAAVLGIALLLSGAFSAFPTGNIEATSAPAMSNIGGPSAGATQPTRSSPPPYARPTSQTVTSQGTPAPTAPAPTVEQPSSTPAATDGANSGQSPESGSSSSGLAGQIISTTSVGLFLLVFSVCGFSISWMLRHKS